MAIDWSGIKATAKKWFGPTTTPPGGGTPKPAVPPTFYGADAATGATPLTVSAENLLRDSANVYANQISGKAYSPIAAGIQEGQARAEAQRRAAAATGINQAGLSGAPLGAGAGYGVEVDLMRNRFDNAIGLASAREADKRAGAEGAQNYANSVNRFTAESMANTQDARNYAQSNWTGTLFNDQALLDALDTPKANQEQVVSDYLTAHPEFAKELQQSKFGGRQFTAAEALREINNARASQNVAQQTYNAFKDFAPGVSYEEFVKGVADGTLLPSLGFSLDEKGNLKMDDSLATDTVSAYKTGRMDFSGYSGVGKGDPVYDKLLSSIKPVSMDDIKAMKTSNPTFKDQDFGDQQGRTVITQFETAAEKGTPVNIDGVLYYVTSSEASKGENRAFHHGISGTTLYTFTDPTGQNEPRTFTTAAQKHLDI